MGPKHSRHDTHLNKVDIPGEFCYDKALAIVETAWGIVRSEAAIARRQAAVARRKAAKTAVEAMAAEVQPNAPEVRPRMHWPACRIFVCFSCFLTTLQHAHVWSE